MTVTNLAESLITALQQPGQERLRDLVRNPLCLTLLCHVWDGSGLPDTQAELYGRYLKKHYLWNQNLKELENHGDRCGKDITQVKAELQQALGELARAALETSGEGFRLSQGLLEQYLGEETNRKSLCHLALQLGLLNRTNIYRQGNNTFAFYHATFQEYFAALAIPDWDYFLPKEHTDRPIPGRAYRIFDPQWKQVILVWLGRGDLSREEKEEFINRLVNFDTGCSKGDFYYGRAYFLAAAGINEFKTCSLAKEIVRQVVEWGFGYFNIEKEKWQTFLEPIEEGARERIPETIRQLAITELIAIIKHSTDESTKSDAAESLEKIDKDNPEVIAALVDLIRTAQDESTRRWAADRLGSIGKDNLVAIAALTELICTAQDEDSRRAAAYNLGEIDKDNPVAIAALTELIRIAQDEDTRRRSAYYLGKIDKDNPIVISALVEFIRTSQNKDIGWRVVYSSGEIGKDNPMVISAFVELIRKLICTAQDESNWKAAAYSLGKIIKDNPETISAQRWVAEGLGNMVGKDNLVVISALVDLIRTAQDECTWMLAAESLDKVGKDNPVAIAALVDLIRTTQDEFTRRRAAESLDKVGKDNPVAIAALVDLIRTTQDEFTRRRAAKSLGKIGKDNLVAITALVELIGTTKDESTRRWAAASLENIGKNNPVVIAALVELIGTTEDEYTQRQAADSLGEIGTDNPVAITALVELIRTTQNESTKRQAADSLGKIDKDNPVAITALVELIRTAQNKDTGWRAAASLGNIGKDHPVAITALVELIRTTQNEDTKRKAADSLGKIDKDNPVAIAALVELIRTAQDKNTHNWAAASLGEIDKDNPVAIVALVELTRTAQDEYTRRWAKDILEKIGKDNPVAIAALVELTRTAQDEYTRRWAARRLGEILTTPEQYAGVVSALKDGLSDEVCQNNFDLYENCYRVLWQCAENLPYPEFYQAWHSHLEVTEQTPVGHNSTVASLEAQKIDICRELQNLPIFCLKAQILAAETRESEIAVTLCQLIWDKALPDADYPEAVTTPSDLRNHLKQLQRNQKLPKLAILLTDCEHPTPELITFCHTLTNILSIAWLTNEPLEAPLKGFPSDQPNLPSAIETWLEEI